MISSSSLLMIYVIFPYIFQLVLTFCPVGLGGFGESIDDSVAEQSGGQAPDLSSGASYQRIVYLMNAVVGFNESTSCLKTTCGQRCLHSEELRQLLILFGDWVLLD